jgi:cytoskeletal protein RodZ
VGATLKKARERRGISLRQVADTTKISVPVLQALERDDISNLPGGVVGRGFVRSFATTVHLDPEAIVASFVAQFPDHSVNDGYPGTAPGEGSERLENQPSKTVITIHRWEPPLLLRLTAALAVPALIVYGSLAAAKTSPRWAALHGKVVAAAANLADNAIRAAGFDDSDPPRSAPPRTPTTSDPPPVASVAEAAASPELPSVTVPTSLAISAEMPSVPVQPPAPTAPVSPSPVDAPASPTRSDAMLVAAPVRDEPIKVSVSASSPSWLIALVDGKKTVNRLMEAGEEESFEARREVVLTAGNAGAIVMTFNGAPAQSLGAAGETATVHLNHATLGNYSGVSREQ